MVVPIVIGGVAYIGILAVSGAAGRVVYLAQREDGIVDSVADTVFNELKERGAPIVESLATQLSSALSTIGSNLGNATLEVLEFAGPRIVDGIDNTYDYIREKIRGSEPAIIEAMTFGFLAVLTVVYIWNTAKKGA